MGKAGPSGPVFFFAPQYDFGKPSTFSPMKLRMSCGLIGRDARDHHFAQVTLDVIFLGVAETAVGHHRLFACMEACLAGEIFRAFAAGPHDNP